MGINDRKIFTTRIVCAHCIAWHESVVERDSTHEFRVSPATFLLPVTSCHSLLKMVITPSGNPFSAITPPFSHLLLPLHSNPSPFTPYTCHPHSTQLSVSHPDSLWYVMKCPPDALTREQPQSTNRISTRILGRGEGKETPDAELQLCSSTRMNHLFLGFIMSVTAPIVAQQTTMPAHSKYQKTLKTVSNGFIMIISESMLNPKNK